MAQVPPSVKDLAVGQLVAFGGGEGSGHGETVVAGRNLVVPVPDGVPLHEATFATLGSIAMHAVRTANIGLGEKSLSLASASSASWSRSSHVCRALW